MSRNMINKGLQQAIGSGQKSAVKQAAALQKELELNRAAINELIEVNTDQTKGIVAIWTVMRKLAEQKGEYDYANAGAIFDQVEKDLDIKMRLD